MKFIHTVVLFSVLFYSCNGAKTKQTNQAALLSAAQNQSSCPGEMVATTAQLPVSFTYDTGNSKYYAFVYVTVKKGQSVVFRSSQSNLNDFGLNANSIYLGQACNSSSPQYISSQQFTLDPATSTSSTEKLFQVNADGNYTFYPNIANSATQPKDVTVQIQ